MTHEQQRTELKSTLCRLGFQQEQVDNLFKRFHFPLENGPFSIAINNWQIQDDFFVDLHFEKRMTFDRFQLTQMRALLHQPQPIPYTVIYGIDTRMLEDRMRSLDWTFDYRSLEQETTLDNPKQMHRYKEYISTIHSLVMVSADDQQGIEISNELKLRHLLATPYEDRFVSGSLTQGRSQARVFHFEAEQGLSLQQTRNVLEGRAVQWDLGNFAEGGKNWLKIIKNEDGSTAEKWLGVLFKKQERHPDYNLAGLLEQLPIIYGEHLSPSILLSNLQQGTLQPVTMRRYGETVAYNIEAAPEKRSVNIYNAKKHRISEHAIIEESKAIERRGSKSAKHRTKSK